MVLNQNKIVAEKLKKKGFKVKEVGITWENAPESKLSFSAPFTMLWELLKMRFS